MFAPVLALLQATGFTVYDGHVPDSPPYPYAVVFANTPDLTLNSLRHTSGRADLRFQVTSVALSAEGVRIVAKAMQDALTDVTPVVADWITYPIRFVSGQPAREDRDVTDTATNLHPLVVVDSYRLSAERA